MTWPTFTVEKVDHADRTVIRFAGELDAAFADEIRAEIRSTIEHAVGRRLVLDLSTVSFLDSSAIGTVLWARDLGRKRNTALVVVAPPGTRAARVFELAGIGSLVPIVDDDHDV